MVKGGAAYRHWQFDRASIANNNQINGELQAGFGVKITPKTKLTLYYQGIYSSNVSFHHWHQ